MARVFADNEDVTQPFVQHLADKLPETRQECDRTDYTARPESWERQDPS